MKNYDFDEALLPFYYCLKIFGLITFKLRNNLITTKEYIISKYDTIFNLIFRLIAIGILFYYSQSHKTVFKETATAPTVATDEKIINVEVLLVTIPLVLILILMAYYQKTHYEIYKSIYQFDQFLLQNMHIQITYRTEYYFCVLAIPFIIIVYGTLSYVEVLYPGQVGYDNVYYIILYHYSLVTTTLMSTEFVILVWILRKRFQNLNYIIVEFVHDVLTSVGKKETEIDILLSNMKKKSINVIAYNSNNIPRTSSADGATVGQNKFGEKINLVEIFNEDYLVEKLQKIGVLYEQLCDICSKINTVFGFLLLYKTVYSIYLLINALFHLYDYIENSEKSSRYTLEYVVSETQWSIFLFIQLVTTVLSCEMTCQESLQAAHLLHKVKNPPVSVKTKLMLELFSLQLYHQKIEFSASGFFALDFSLMQMIVGITTTYLVILIQFNQ